MRHLKNPIGLQTLGDVVASARRVGFEIIEAKLVYEPVDYESTDDYVTAAEAYGRSVYLAPLMGKPDEVLDEAWDRLKTEFNAAHSDLPETESAEYIHDQFMIYIVLGMK